jgi:hypothetical protein
MGPPVLLLVSSIFLFEFGRRLVLATRHDGVDSQAAGSLLQAWIYVPPLLEILAGAAVSAQPLVAIEIRSRYLLGFAGATLAGAGFMRYRRASLAHSLKGVARTLGAHGLGELTANLEAATGGQDPVLVEEHLGRTMREMGRVMVGLERIA